jgi:hypothetical protein
MQFFSYNLIVHFYPHSLQTYVTCGHPSCDHSAEAVLYQDLPTPTRLYYPTQRYAPPAKSRSDHVERGKAPQTYTPAPTGAV